MRLNNLRKHVLTALLLLISGAAGAVEIAVISDLNGRYGSTEYNKRVYAAVDAIIERNVDLVIITGDMVAGQHSKLGKEDLKLMWSAFHDAVSDPLARAGIPLVVTPGNHDGSAMPGFESERDEFRRQWSNRTSGLQLLEGSQWPDRFALQFEELLVIGFDGTRPGKLDVEEFRFLELMLTRHAHAAGSTVVLSHLPMWPLAEGRERDIIPDPDLLDLLQDHDVQVYASGHHHVFFSGFDNAGLMHLSVGSLGGNTRAFADGTPRQPFSLTLLRLEADWVFAEALAAPDFQTVLPQDSMPGRMKGSLGVLRRGYHSEP